MIKEGGAKDNANGNWPDSDKSLTKVKPINPLAGMLGGLIPGKIFGGGGGGGGKKRKKKG